jgi:1,2-diacylglycerol 3-alpha-glucosyltransferase
MKIAIYTDNFYPELSGISDSVITFGKNLSARGHFVDYYVPYYSVKNYTKINLEAKEIDLGANVKVHRFFSFPFPAPTNQGRMVIPTFLRWLEMRRNKPDIIHTQDFFGVGWEAAAAAKFLKVPMVGTNHTPISEFIRYSPVKVDFMKDYIIKFVSNYYNRCEFITAPCNCILDEMKKYGLTRPAFKVSNPIEVKNFFPVSDAEKKNLKNKFKLSKNAILFTGRLAAEKHVDVLINAVNIIKNEIEDVNLVIAGHGDAEKSLRELVNKQGLADHVKFLGTLDTKTHVEIYQAIDIFAIASTAEMQSISLMKAMATSLPVIGINAWALPEYINQDNGFIVEPGDYRAMAEKIIYLFKNRDMMDKLGRGGLEYVKNFAEETITDRWEDLYAGVLK